jgi:hypothetical protein
MNKTCYFCEYETKCGVPYPYFKLITEDVCKTRHITNRFKPTEEWLYIEKLEKENEELKKQIENNRPSKAMEELDVMFTRFNI